MPLVVSIYTICVHIDQYTQNNFLVPQEMGEILSFLMAELITCLLSIELKISTL